MNTTADRDAAALRVLVVDDEPDFVLAQSLLSKIEGRQFKVEWAASHLPGGSGAVGKAAVPFPFLAGQLQGAASSCQGLRTLRSGVRVLRWPDGSI